MNSRLKTALKVSFSAPLPVGRERFIQTLNYPKVTYQKFLLSQIYYIRKRVWVFSIVIVFVGWVSAFWSPVFFNLYTQSEKIWSVSAALPFLAMLTVTELYRSSYHRMSELETVCRFSQPQIIMSRITFLGGENFIILLLLMIIMSKASVYSLLQVITYLMVPYLVTCGSCLLILNRVRGRESVYCCAIATCLACVTNIICSSSIQSIYLKTNVNYWLLLLISSSVLIAIQMHKLIKKKEVDYETYP